MSLGVGCYAEKIYEDQDKVVYAYGAFDWNDRSMWNEEKDLDGQIEIEKYSFLSDDDISFEKLLRTQKIIIKNSRYCNRRVEDYGNCYDTIALSWLFKLSRYIKEHHEFPPKLNVLK